MDSQVEIVFIFTDNCSAQNKNHALVNNAIVHRYPEPGHSFLPRDRAFGLIEKKRRKLERVKKKNIKTS